MVQFDDAIRAAHQTLVCASRRPGVFKSCVDDACTTSAGFWLLGIDPHVVMSWREIELEQGVFVVGGVVAVALLLYCAIYHSQ